jgi:hypothetical protein
MMVTFVIPVEGQSSARTEDWGVEAVPRISEMVRLENGSYRVMRVGSEWFYLGGRRV